MSQVSYGAFLGNDSGARYYTINDKWAVVVVFDQSKTVAAVFEYQGVGHYGNDRVGRKRAEQSDNIMRRACADAGGPFIETPTRIDRGDVPRIAQEIMT
jgi:hypothetical protein